MNYLLDTNTLIEAKNRYYHMDICPGYWSWLIKKSGEGVVASISFVLDELKKGDDELKEWAQDQSALFIDVSDTPTQGAYSDIVQYVAALSPKMKYGAMEDFLSGADPWLIAKAKTSGATIVTHEVINEAIKKKFLIPNICQIFNVPFINTFELLLKLEAEFVLAS